MEILLLFTDKHMTDRKKPFILVIVLLNQSSLYLTQPHVIMAQFFT